VVRGIGQEGFRVLFVKYGIERSASRLRRQNGRFSDDSRAMFGAKECVKTSQGTTRG